ncbi:MAG: SIR2 family NAD-dependent protein deacylase [Actinomycetota bacterium]
MDARAELAGLRAEVAAGRLIPYLGPDLLGLDADPPVPAGARELALKLGAKVAVPGRFKNNLWHSAQYIESHRHRMTLDRLLAAEFAATPDPGPLQRWLAGLGVPLVVDTWYDGALTAAFAGRPDWGQLQGASKARRTDVAPWVRAFRPDGAECDPVEAAGWGTVVYKPHGAGWPQADMLASDSDYVEVLTELDIQTPIPDAVKDRRQGKGFLLIGCRFWDQILRNFARSVMKHSGGPRFAVVPDELTRNEIRFLEAEGIRPLAVPLAEAVALLTT